MTLLHSLTLLMCVDFGHSRQLSSEDFFVFSQSSTTVQPFYTVSAAKMKDKHESGDQ